MCTHTHTHTHTGILAIKKNEILPFAMTWMELECIMLREISQSEKDKYHMISLVWNLRNKTYEHIGSGGKEREERERNHKRLLTIEYKLRVDGGKWVVDNLDG